jgi:PHP family Zn ribbon phosphoesterase
MTQKGPHTWDLYLHYHRCPKCGNIIESREDYENRFGKYVKDLTCSRCHHRFTLEKTVKPTFGPFTGDPQPAEFEWETL